MISNSPTIEKKVLLTFDIGLVFDLNYVHHFYVLATSILKNNKHNVIHFHIIAVNVPGQVKNEIREFMSSNQGQVTFYELTREMHDQLIMPETEERYTIINFYRLFFPYLISEKIEKFLYIDTDIIVVNPLDELFGLDISEVYFAAVIEPTVTAREDLGIFQPNSYFNAGVILFNPDRWRREKVTDKAIAFLHKHPEKCKYLDQDILNAVSINKWKPIDKRFNLMDQYIPNLKKHEYKAYAGHQNIIHFNRLKPWEVMCASQLKFVYFNYYQQSPVANIDVAVRFRWTLRNLYMFLRFRFEKNYYVLRLIDLKR